MIVGRPAKNADISAKQPRFGQKFAFCGVAGVSEKQFLRPTESDCGERDARKFLRQGFRAEGELGHVCNAVPWRALVHP